MGAIGGGREDDASSSPRSDLDRLASRHERRIVFALDWHADVRLVEDGGEEGQMRAIALYDSEEDLEDDRRRGSEGRDERVSS